MYQLTLNLGERRAIDWVGHRYTNGDALYHLLIKCDWTAEADDRSWADPGDITFSVPENVAWEIQANAESEDGSWPCFAPELAEKMQAFVDSIV